MADVPKVSDREEARMSDVKVTRETVRRTRSLCLEMEGDSYSLESIADIAALVALAEALVGAEEDGTLASMELYLAYDDDEQEPFMIPFLQRVRALLGKEERPGE